MRRIIKKYMVGGFVALLLIFSCACADEAVEDVTATSEEAIKEPRTEQEYREAIASLGEEESDLQLSLEYYDKLWLLDAFTEEDFTAVCNIYAALGDAENLRNTLIRKHTYYPSEANLKEITNVIVYKDATDTAVQTIMDNLLIALQEETTDNTKLLIGSEEWKAEMQDDLIGVSRKTLYTGSGYRAQITSDTYETDIYIIKDDMSVIYYKNNSAGEIIGNVMLEKDAYNGDYIIGYYNTDGEFIKECKGTFQNGVTVGEFTIEYDGRIYTGEFDENGKTTVEQKDKITDDGGVIYAYNKSAYKYLYAENAAVDNFIIDYSYLGMPAYEEWQ